MAQQCQRTFLKMWHFITYHNVGMGPFLSELTGNIIVCLSFQQSMYILSYVDGVATYKVSWLNSSLSWEV